MKAKTLLLAQKLSNYYSRCDNVTFNQVKMFTAHMTKHLLITPKKLALGFAAIVFLLLIANIACIVMEHRLRFTFHTMHIFHFNKEGNIPSIYSALAILICAGILYLISNLTPERLAGRRPYWQLLMIIFIFLTLDELVSVHETFTDNTKAFLGNEDADGFLHFAWVVPYLVIFGGIGLVLIRFLLRLPRRTATLFVIAGGVFVTGAIGLEMIGGNYVALHGESGKIHLFYALIVTVEELLEMTGIIIFIYALSEFYLKNVQSSIRLDIVLAEKETLLKTPDTARTLAPELPMIDESLN